MQPGNLVFVVLLGGWVAYFVVYWTRRREHLATARSLERFSSSMRVLEVDAADRLAATVDPPSGPRVSPLRALGGRVAAASARVAEARTDSSRPVEARPSTGRSGGPSRGGRPGRAGRPGRPAWAMRPSRRVRGLVFLAAMALTLVLTPLAIGGLVSWWAILASYLVGVAGFLWLRQGIAAETRARARVRRARKVAVAVRATTTATGSDAARRPAEVRSGRAAAESGPSSRRVVDVETKAEARTDIKTDIKADAETGSGSAPFDAQSAPVAEAAPAPAASVGPEVGAVTAPVRAVARSLDFQVDEDDLPLTWSPIPVPAPTYTMKASAQGPAPLAASAVSRIPSDAQVVLPQTHADDFDSDDDIVPLRERRAATG